MSFLPERPANTGVASCWDHDARERMHDLEQWDELKSAGGTIGDVSI
jgi:hypothetical protein